jgi:hypothetical protein
MISKIIPRLPSSIKWLEIPLELKKNLQEAFSESFHNELKKKTQWFIDGYLYPEEILIRVGFGQKDALKHHHYLLSWNTDFLKDQDHSFTSDLNGFHDFNDYLVGKTEISNTLNTAKTSSTSKVSTALKGSIEQKTTMEELYAGFSYLHHLISEHIQGLQKDLPRTWTPVILESKKECFFQYCTKNETLESIADQLLGHKFLEKEQENQDSGQGSYEDFYEEKSSLSKGAWLN